MPEVVVIGAGITGLTCAWALQKQGVDVLVLESSSRVGGVIRTQVVGSYLVESGPNTALPTPEVSTMIDELGLGPDLLTANPREPRYVLVNGRLRKVPFGPLSWGGLLRACAEPFIRSRSAEDESVAGFFRRRVGVEAHDRLVAPFAAGIYAGNTEKLSMAATFPSLVEFERKHGSVVVGVLRAPKKPRARLSTFVDGMETLPRRLARDLRIQFNVDDIFVTKDLVLSWNGGEMKPKVIVFATPAYVAARIINRLSPEAASLLNRVEYAPMVVAASSAAEAQMSRPPVGFGFLVPRSEKIHLLGTLFSSALFPGRAPKGRVLFTSFIGGVFEPDAICWTEDRVWETVGTELSRILRISGGIEPVALIRHERAIPQYRIGHEKWVDAIRSRFKQWPGLFLAGNYLDGLSTPACMEVGRRTAQAVVDFMR